MKKITLWILPFIIGLSANIFSNTVTISAGGFAFSPNSTTLNVGDTIKWVWGSGTHTTTSTSVPSGALTWNAALDNINTSFTYVVTVAGQYSYQCNFHVAMGMTGTINANPIGIVPISGNVPEKYMLYQNFPNPFNPVTNIKFDLPKRTMIELKIFDLTGGVVETIANGEIEAGSYSVDWNASSNASGIYFYSLKTAEYSSTKKMVVVK